MSGTLRVAVDAGAVSVARSIAAAARLAPLLVITHRALADLADELGGYEPAARRLLAIATDADRPIGVDAPTGPDTSRTWFVAPKHWTREEVADWVAAHHEALERQFGAASVVTEEDEPCSRHP